MQRWLKIGVCVGVLLLPAGLWAASRGGKIIRMEELRIEGRVQKPQVTYILSLFSPIQGVEE